METFTQFLLKNYKKEYEDYKEEDLSLSISGGLALGEIERYFRINHIDIFKNYLFKNLKGRVIRYKAIVKSAYKPSNYVDQILKWELHIGQDNPNYRGIYRLEVNYTSFDILGICLGYSYLNTGWYRGMGAIYTDYDPPHFILDKRVKVFVIEEIINDNRYYKPIYALPEDIII